MEAWELELPPECTTMWSGDANDGIEESQRIIAPPVPVLQRSSYTASVQT